jgi:tetracycline resistance efflux pump
MTPSYLSLIPPLVAIMMALITKQTYLSLLTALWLGSVILSSELLTGSLNTLHLITDVFKDEGNTRTIIFSALMGGLLLLIQKSGGIQGFIDLLSSRLSQQSPENGARKVRVWAFFTGVLIFIETTISSLTVGTLFRPMADQYKVSREALAYIADTTSAPTSVLLPFNAWGAFIMGLLAKQGISQGFMVLLMTLPFNFYAILSLVCCGLFAFFNLEFGPMKKAGERTRSGQLLDEGALPLMSDHILNLEMAPNTQARAINMLLPIFTMILVMPSTLIYTGWLKETAQISMQGSFWGKLFIALSAGSGSFAVLLSIVTALLVAMISYQIQGIFSIKQMIDLILKGISELMPLALLMVFAFAMSTLCKDLGTGLYVAQLLENTLPMMLFPALIFILAAVISFATGTSWGTFGILIPITVPLAQALMGQALAQGQSISEAYLYLMISAVLGGGVFGDHTSPISDTTIVSSMSAASDHLAHVKTQMPYALVVASFSLILYLCVGLYLCY